MNLFESYIEESESIHENLAAITAKEQRREANSWGYAADMDNLQEDIQAMRSAFKDTVYRFAATLPDGWRVIGDFDKWLNGEACAGFVHGGMKPDARLMIGGELKTVLAIEQALAHLHQFVWQMEA